MHQYHYSPISETPGSIRLLRLLPNEDEESDIECELFEYCLQESAKATHPYEALSYVWGSSHNPQHILIGGQYLTVTPNLHAVLLRLRDRHLARVIWIDAACINQEDEQEKAGQIQYMEKIYGKASRVLVWLGPATDDSDIALEAIRAAGIRSTNSSHEQIGNIHPAITALIQRQWFRRIWVLQEVAAARHILILCGHTEIDGYAFCLGLELLNSVPNSPSDLHSRVRSVIYLIRGAIFRRKYDLIRSERDSLDICPLGELIDMYHTHEASKRHDKVFALLGMSSDDASIGGLLPDYKVPWKELLQRLVKFFLGEQVSIKTWDNKEVAEICGRGCVLGQVSRVESGQDGRQMVTIMMKNDTSASWKYTNREETQWSLHASAKHTQNGDIVCLLQEASKSMIIRPYKDHFAIIMIVANPPGNIETLLFPHHFRLLWDWEKSPGKPQYRREHHEHSQKRREGEVGGIITQCDAALIMDDVGKHEDAKKRLLDAFDGHEAQIEDSEIQFTEQMVLEIARIFNKEVMVHLLTQKHAKCPITEQVVGRIVRRFDSEVTTLLLQQMGDEFQITERVVKKAARNPDHGKAFMKLLLMQERVKIQITEQAVVEIARRFDKEVVMLLLTRKWDKFPIIEEAVIEIVSQFDEEVIALLLKQNGEKIQITETVIAGAVKNMNSGREVIKRLLKQKGGRIQVTEQVAVEVATRFQSKEAIKSLLEQIGDRIQITEQAMVEIASRIDKEAMAVLLERKGDDIQITNKVVEAAAINPNSGRGLMTLLLSQKREEIRITEELLKKVASNSWNGRAVMEGVLSKRKGKTIQVTEDVAVAASWNMNCGGAVLACLLKEKGNKIQITEGAALRIMTRFGTELTALLLKRKEIDLQITDEVVLHIVRTFDKEIMKLLLKRKENGVQITVRVVEAALQNRTSGKEVLVLLLQQRRDKIQIAKQAEAYITKCFDNDVKRLLH